MRNIYNTNSKQKKTGVTIVIIDKINFKTEHY